MEKELEVYKSIMEVLPQSIFLPDKHKNIINSHLKAIVTKISGERIISQVHIITDTLPQTERHRIQKYVLQIN